MSEDPAASPQNQERERPDDGRPPAPGANLPILVATDFSVDSRSALARAAWLARILDKPLDVLHVLNAALLGALQARSSGSADSVAHLRADADHELQRSVEQLVDRFPGLSIQGRLLEGDVLTMLVAACARSALTVVGAHGQHPFRDPAPGSTGERLVRRSGRSVLIVHGETRVREVSAAHTDVMAPWERVVVGIDFSRYSAAALDWARRVGVGARVEALHAWEVPFEGRLRTAGVGRDEIVHLRARVRSDALSRMRALIDDAGIERAEVETHVVHGYAPHRLVDRARAIGAGLIVVGKHGESMLDDLLLGSVALHVLAHAECDVLIVQPGDAVSPEGASLP